MQRREAVQRQLDVAAAIHDVPLPARLGVTALGLGVGRDPFLGAPFGGHHAQRRRKAQAVQHQALTIQPRRQRAIDQAHAVVDAHHAQLVAPDGAGGRPFSGQRALDIDIGLDRAAHFHRVAHEQADPGQVGNVGVKFGAQGLALVQGHAAVGVHAQHGRAGAADGTHLIGGQIDLGVQAAGVGGRGRSGQIQHQCL